MRKCTRKISRLLPYPAKFITLGDTTNTNTSLSLKEATPKECQSSVVYKFTFPGCQASYIGKTDRYLYTRRKKHTYSKNSEIYNRINICEHFLHIQSLLNLPSNIYTLNESTILPQIIFNNCKVLDKAKHWTLLLFKEVLSIHREKPLLNHGTKASKELVIFYWYVCMTSVVFFSWIYSSHYTHSIPDDGYKIVETLKIKMISIFRVTIVV